MLDLAEDTLERTPRRRWLGRVAIAAIVIGLAIGLALWLRELIGSPAAAKRQVAKISILPDTPPPPPPKVERKPEPPKDEPKQAVREQAPKAPDTPKPAEAPIKMEGAAGDGPSAFAAGPVGEDYKGGAPVIGAAASGGGGTASDRAQERFYANTARQLLRDEIEKHLKPEAGEVVATFAIWIEPSGRIQKIELVPGSNAATDTDLRAALDETSRRLQLPQHTGLTQPLRFRLSMRAAG